MGIDNIWVFAQTINGEATAGTLELLTKARSLGGSVTAFVAGEAGGGAAAMATGRPRSTRRATWAATSRVSRSRRR